MRLRISALCALALSFLCLTSGTVDPLAAMSDEFDDPASLSSWSRAYLEDGWAHDLVESESIADGQFTVIPYSSGWFERNRGNFYFKELTGDFIMTARVNATGRTTNVPSSPFSLGGIMARRPNGNFGEWNMNDELWSFIAMGTGDAVNTRNQYEVKTTIDSQSILELRDVDPTELTDEIPSGIVQIARFGNNLMILVKPDGHPWEVFRCYGPSTTLAQAPYSDIPLQTGPIQVGMHMYTDYFAFDGQTDTNGSPPLPLNESNPDLKISYDYIRFCTPNTSLAVLNQDWFATSCSLPGGNTWDTNCCASGVDQVLAVLGANGDSCVTGVIGESNSTSTSSPTSSPIAVTNTPSSSPETSLPTMAPTLGGFTASSAKIITPDLLCIALLFAFLWLQ